MEAESQDLLPRVRGSPEEPQAGEPGNRAPPFLQLTPCLTQWRMARKPEPVEPGRLSPARVSPTDSEAQGALTLGAASDGPPGNLGKGRRFLLVTVAPETPGIKQQGVGGWEGSRIKTASPAGEFSVQASWDPHPVGSGAQVPTPPRPPWPGSNREGQRFSGRQGNLQCRSWGHPVCICEGHSGVFKRMAPTPQCQPESQEREAGSRGGAHPSPAHPGSLLPESWHQEGPLAVLRASPQCMPAAGTSGHRVHSPGDGKPTSQGSSLCFQTHSGIWMGCAPT